MKKYGIIGWPLGHTLSPTLHNYGFKTCAIDAVYEAWPTQKHELDRIMKRVKTGEIQGMSVTIPHKQDVMNHVDSLTQRAQSVGAVNTIFHRDGKIWGENTDVDGLVTPLKQLEKLPKKAVVLGAGGAARAAVAGLCELGIDHVFICNRTESKAQTIADDFEINCRKWEKRYEIEPDLILNTTPLGMSGDMQDRTPWEQEFPIGCIVYDIVYNPLETKLLADAKESGCTVIQGLEMFLHQGLAQFRLWTGQELETEAARQVLLDALK